LLKALHTYCKNLVHPAELAAQACEIELEKLGGPIGKQDQYISAYGGITCFRFEPDGKVEAWPLRLSPETLLNPEDNLLLMFTGYSRSASEILKEQHTKSQQDDAEMLQNLHFVKELGLYSQKALEAGCLEKFADLMNEHWEHKKKRSKWMSNSRLRSVSIKSGALYWFFRGIDSGRWFVEGTHTQSLSLTTNPTHSRSGSSAWAWVLWDVC